jgi:hypothetical protein
MSRTDADDPQHTAGGGGRNNGGQGPNDVVIVWAPGMFSLFVLCFF